MQAKKHNLIHGLKFIIAFSIFHLLFANDSLVFSRASNADYKNSKKVFDVYATTSSQIFNFEKSSMFFNSNTNRSKGHGRERSLMSQFVADVGGRVNTLFIL